MKKRRGLIVLFVFIVLVSAYYFGAKPLLAEKQEAFYIEDDFNSLNSDFWYVANMTDNEEEIDSITAKNSEVVLEKNYKGDDLYLLSKPIPIGKKQLLKIKRKVKIDPASKYFSGGLVVFQTNSKSKRLSIDKKFPYGKAIFMIDYVKNPGKKGKRPGKNNIRILPVNWEKEKNAVLIKPIYNKYFYEEVIYNSYTGMLEYKVNDETYSVETAPIKDKNIRIWMHAYGNSRKQCMKVDYISIKLENVEEIDMED